MKKENWYDPKTQKMYKDFEEGKKQSTPDIAPAKKKGTWGGKREGAGGTIGNTNGKRKYVP